MAIHELKEQIARLPEQPGVYLFANRDGETIYVGKARVLRDRVRSYLGAMGMSPRIDALLRDASALEFIVTDSVVEALALENGLIKQRNPRYNVLLRDDKTYPYLQLTLTERAPRMLVARQVQRDGNAYAGPFMPAQLARKTMALSHRLFGIRSCNEVIDGKRDRPCLEYDIKRCLAPCVDAICSIERYDDAVAQARLLMDGKQSELIEGLRTEMFNAASAEEFERAAQLRDAIRTIETLRDRQQKMATPALGDRDAFGAKSGASGSLVSIFQMRGGRVVDRQELKGNDPMIAESELVAVALQQFYADRVPPAEIHVAVELDPGERDAIEAWLGARAGRKVSVLVPKRGDKRGLLDLAVRNAAMAYQQQFGEGAGAAFEALDTLRLVLNLPGLPRRIECFDISTLQGANTVASMVVAVEGRMRKGEYRKFRIRTTEESGQFLDDFAAMEQVVLRRYHKLLEQGGPFPDLIVIDGGKGQLAAAYKALRQVGLERLVAIGLAKQEELIFTRERDEGIALPHHTAALQLLQRIRDEAHRFAITFHRASRQKATLRSELDGITGIGARRRNLLLRTFGSVAGVRRASREELTAAVGAKAAQAVIDYFAR
jgi:excinuclease ABC subunit C